MAKVQVWVSRELVTAAMTTGWTERAECIEGLPTDSTLLHAYVREGGRELVLEFDCPSLSDEDVSQFFAPVYRTLEGSG